VAAALGTVGPGGRLGALGLAPLAPPSPRDDDDDNYPVAVVVVIVVIVEDDAATIANTDVAITEDDDDDDRRAAANNNDCIRASYGAVVGLDAAVGRGQQRRGADVRGVGIARAPRIGDFVRYYDVDGGRADGQVLVGKILLIQSIRSSSPSSSSPSSSSSSLSLSSSDGTNRWLVEVIKLEDVGDGYYAEYPYRKRPRPALRKLEDLAPLPALYVRSESAYKVPLDGRGRGTGHSLPSHPGYDLAGYDGPVAMLAADAEVVTADSLEFALIKLDLLKDATVAGLAGAVLVDAFGGAELGVRGGRDCGGRGYLYLLGVKTDTLGGVGSRGERTAALLLPLPLPHCRLAAAAAAITAPSHRCSAATDAAATANSTTKLPQSGCRAAATAATAALPLPPLR
jgi:hypothetical protein